MTPFYRPPQFSNQLPTHVLCGLISTSNHFAVKTKNGKQKALGFLTGQIMKETKGNANPTVVNKVLEEKLSNYNI